MIRWYIKDIIDSKSLIDKYTELLINLGVHFFKLKHSENQLIISKRGNKESFFILNISKSELKDNDIINII